MESTLLFIIVYVTYCVLYYSYKEGLNGLSNNQLISVDRIDSDSDDNSSGDDGLHQVDESSVMHQICDVIIHAETTAPYGWDIIEPRYMTIRELKEIAKNRPANARINKYSRLTQAQLEDALS